jgi:hypothetical protein
MGLSGQLPSLPPYPKERVPRGVGCGASLDAVTAPVWNGSAVRCSLYHLSCWRLAVEAGTDIVI